MRLELSLSNFARGGGCFLEGTMIATPKGDVVIEKLRPGDKVVSYNETTGKQEVSTIGAIDVLERDHFYIVNGIIKATGEHPFYTNQGIVEVKDLNTHHMLTGRYDKEIPVRSLSYHQQQVKVYNLLNVLPNNNYYANNLLVHNKGGSCFLAGTEIHTYISLRDNTFNSDKIENLEVGDKVVSLNEKNGEKEYSTIERIDKIVADNYYIINKNVKVTGEHPFYTTAGLKKVKDLRIGDVLHTLYNDEKVTSIEFVEEDVVVYNLINVEPNHNYYADYYLVHNKGGFSSGGRSSASSRTSTSSKSSTSKSTSSSKTTSSTPSKPKTSSKPGTSTAKPGSTVKTTDGKTVKSSTVKPNDPKYSKETGIVGDNGYTPRFTNGYAAPAGSVVYYRDNSASALDYLPWIYLFSHNNPATPAAQQATIVQPDGKQVEAKPAQEGVDGLAILNWILLIGIVLGIIWGIMWGVNKLSTKDNK